MPDAKVDRMPSGPQMADLLHEVPVIAPRGRVIARMLNRGLERILKVWRLSQVELRGEYSVERLMAFDAYSRTAPPSRVLLVFFGTAIPCLLAIVVLESIPLAPIEDGIQHSRNFWYRTTIGTYMLTHSIAAQFHHGIPQLDLPVKQLVFISALTTAVLMPVLYEANLLVGFPMPFFVITSMAPWYPIILSISWVLLRDQLRKKPIIITGFKQQILIFNLQSLLTILYPAYTYVFNTCAEYQMWWALLLPVMKLAMKNCFGFASRHMDDSKPELVVFNVEIFSALYVSSCMQSTNSVAATVVIMIVDFVQSWMAIKDLCDVLDEPFLKRVLGNGENATRLLFPLTKCIFEANPSVYEHPSIRVKSFAPTPPIINPARTQRLVVIPTGGTAADHHAGSTPPGYNTEEASQGRRKCLLRPLDGLFTLVRERRVHSVAEYEALKKLAATLSDDEQLLVVQKTLRILHIAEFTALVEYAEVFVPIVYSVFCVIAYTFPNGRFYTTFGALSGAEFVSALGNVMLYGSLELLSFVGLDLILRYKFRVSTFALTAFVQETQWAMVQSKLTMWILVVPQFALQHYGSDFSFQFKWLKR